MRNYLIKSMLVLACVTLVSVALPVKAQSNDVGLSMAASPTTVAQGGTVVVSALVTNNTSKRMRTTVTLKSSSPCGTETSLADRAFFLDAGRTVALTFLYPISADACTGMYSLTMSASSGKNSDRNATAASTSTATAFVTVTVP